jgi:hypothetical protein
MSPTCENSTRAGDCLTRNARILCDSCFELLTPSELDTREVCFMVADYARKAQRQLSKLKRAPVKCMTLRPNEDRSCLGRELVALCAYCITSMTEAELIAYATAIVARRREIQDYMDAEAEAKEYAASLGIDLNDYCIDFDDFEPKLHYVTFHTSRPCFVHPEETEQAA